MNKRFFSLKKIIFTLLAALLLCSCSYGQDEKLPASTQEPTSKITSASTETPSTTTSESKTETDDISVNFTYEGENPMLKTLSGLSSQMPDTHCLYRYDYCDIDGDSEEELLVIAPHTEENDRYALYIIKQTGEYKQSPPLFSAGELFSSGEQYSVNGTAYYDDNAKPCLAVTTYAPNLKAHAYHLTDGFTQVTVTDPGIIDSTGYHPESIYEGYQIPFYFAKGITSEDFVRKIETEFAKTPLERAADLQSGNKILCDLTGDGFPELVSIVQEGYVYDDSYVIFDVRQRYPVVISQGILDHNEKIRLLLAQNSERKLASKYTLRCAANYGAVTAIVNNLNPGYFSDSIEIGKAEYFWQDNRAYCTELYMNGTEYERIKLSPKEGFDELMNKAFDKMYSDYLSDYEILLEIGLDNNGNITVTGNTSKFSSFPQIGNVIVRKEPAGQYVRISGENIRTDSERITICADRLEDDFDFTVLDRFENLRAVSLITSYDAKYDGRIQITPSRWCSKIKSLVVNTDIYEISGGYGCFENVRSVSVAGKPENLDFLTAMQNIEKFSCEYAPDYEYLLPLTKLPKLAVIEDSGFGSFLDENAGDAPEEIQKKLKEWVWAWVKIG